MDLAEIKTHVGRFGYMQNGGYEWLVTKVEELEAECKERVAEKMEWLGDRGTLQTEIKRLTAEVVATAAKLDECRNDRDKAEAENERLQSYLTLSREEGRREGREEAAKVFDGAKAYCEQKSLYAELAVVDNAWGQAAYEIELRLAAIRSEAKGERK